MARTKKAQYVQLHGITPICTERGMALEAKAEDGRRVFVLASPRKLIALAVRLLAMSVHDWFRTKYNEDDTRMAGVPARLDGPIQFS